MKTDPIDRRQFATLSAAVLTCCLAPTILTRRGSTCYGRVARRESDRPSIAGGCAIGDIALSSTAGADGPHCRAILWSRTDRPSRLWAEWSTTSDFQRAHRVRGGGALPHADGTTRLALDGLPAGQTIFYRLRFQDLAEANVYSPDLTGSFVTPPTDTRNVSFVWGGDVCGQGYGIDPAHGGMLTFKHMLDRRPDFFIHSGDTIYADNPLSPEVALEGGGVWRNIVTEAKSKVAQTLDEFRGNHAYNLLDEHYRSFLASVPMYAQWDDHEVLNNWYPGETLSDKRYREKSVSLLAARAKQAFFDYMPIAADVYGERVYRSFGRGPLLDVFLLDMRSYRGPNTPGRETEPSLNTALLGDEQVAWLSRSLMASKATWKVIAADMPVGLVVPDGEAIEALANGNGPPTGRELEFAPLLASLKRANVKNLIFVTADVHYAAAHHYSPTRARFTDFDPFWEFVAGPLHAGTFGPGKLDDTFGPEVVYSSLPAGMKQNRPPSDNLQFFGHVTIDGKTKSLTVAFVNRLGKQLWSKTLEPAA